MKQVPVDARRYAWSRGTALWIMGLPLSSHLEDLEGARRANQQGLARRIGRAVGESCAIVVAVSGYAFRPLPQSNMRGAWALERITGHELWEDCWTLVRGEDDSVATIATRCQELVARVRAIVGDVPDPLTPDGYFPALATARSWLELLDAVGEPDLLPPRWKQR